MTSCSYGDRLTLYLLIGVPPQCQGNVFPANDPYKSESSKSRVVDSQREQLFCLQSWEKWTFWRLRRCLSRWRAWCTRQDAGLNLSIHTLSWQWVTRILRLGGRELGRLTSHPGHSLSTRCSESPCLKTQSSSDWGSHVKHGLMTSICLRTCPHPHRHMHTHTYLTDKCTDTQIKNFRAQKKHLVLYQIKACFYPPTKLYQILFLWSETSLRTQFFFCNLDEITVERGRKCWHFCKWGKMVNK